MANNATPPQGAPNVWTQMNYVPPRGQCNHKLSLLAAKCPCLRFMLHPLKSSSSYECDGCGHHASFHTMENKVEDEIRKRWEVEAAERRREEEEEEGRQRPKKRVRAIEFGNDDEAVLARDAELKERQMALLELLGGKPKAAPKRTARTAAATRAKSKTAGAGRFIELD